MNKGHLNKNIQHGNWPKVEEILRSSLDEESERLKNLDLFGLFDANYRRTHLIDLHDSMWRLALFFGRVKEARLYLNDLIDHLIVYKRIAKLETLKSEAVVLLSKKDFKKFDVIEIFKGLKASSSEEECALISLHPEKWKHVREAFKNYLLIDSEWSVFTWKMLYEFLIRYHFDAEIIQLIAEKNYSDKAKNYLKWNEVFLKLYTKYKIDKTALTAVSETFASTEVKIDFAQLALEIIESGQEERKQLEAKVIGQLKYSADDYKISDVKEMIIAFTFLGMSEVVEFLCDSILEKIDQAKERISLFYVMSHSLLTCSKYYKAIDLARDVIKSEALLREEKVAFKYIIAEAHYQLRNLKQAYVEFEEILLIDSKHRLTKERLRSIEEGK